MASSDKKRTLKAFVSLGTEYCKSEAPKCLTQRTQTNSYLFQHKFLIPHNHQQLNIFHSAPAPAVQRTHLCNYTCGSELSHFREMVWGEFLLQRSHADKCFRARGHTFGLPMTLCLLTLPQNQFISPTVLPNRQNCYKFEMYYMLCPLRTTDKKCACRLPQLTYTTHAEGTSRQ